MEKQYFKGFIRAVKSLVKDSEYFGSENIIEERAFLAWDKEDAKQVLKRLHPQFFQDGKVYTKETKDQAQFFYVVIYPLNNNEIEKLNKPWNCSHCGTEHESEYFERPHIEYNRHYMNKMFCDRDCFKDHEREIYKLIEFPDDPSYINKNGIEYIYKITEKSTGKCYIGKTKNEPFFRWWNHLRHSPSPFGIYFRNTELTDWTFEVLEITHELAEKIFEVESKYIREYNSIENGFNTIISKK